MCTERKKAQGAAHTQNGRTRTEPTEGQRRSRTEQRKKGNNSEELSERDREVSYKDGYNRQSSQLVSMYHCHW
jgi:hypothetical protein